MCLLDSDVVAMTIAAERQWYDEWDEKKWEEESDREKNKQEKLCERLCEVFELLSPKHVPDGAVHSAVT